MKRMLVIFALLTLLSGFGLAAPEKFDPFPRKQEILKLFVDEFVSLMADGDLLLTSDPRDLKALALAAGLVAMQHDLIAVRALSDDDLIEAARRVWMQKTPKWDAGVSIGSGHKLHGSELAL